MMIFCLFILQNINPNIHYKICCFFTSDQVTSMGLTSSCIPKTAETVETAPEEYDFRKERERYELHMDLFFKKKRSQTSTKRQVPQESPEMVVYRTSTVEDRIVHQMTAIHALKMCESAPVPRTKLS